jgi:hypothetical protein
VATTEVRTGKTTGLLASDQSGSTPRHSLRVAPATEVLPNGRDGEFYVGVDTGEAAAHSDEQWVEAGR